MSQGSKLLRGSFARVANMGLGIVISFFMMPFLIHSLGDRMYGLWSLVGAIVGYYGLLDIGLSSAVGRFISRAIGKQDGHEIRRVTSTSFYLYLIVALLATLITFTIAMTLPLWIPNPDDLPVFQTLLLLLGLNFAFDVPVRSFNSVFSSNLREDINMALAIVRLLVTSLFIVLAVNAGYGVIGVGIVAVTFSVLDSLTRIFFAYRVEENLSINPGNFTKELVRPLFNYSIYSFISRMADILRFRLDQLVITIYVGLSAVTHYFIAVRLVELITELLTQMVNVLMPAFSQAEGRNDKEGIRQNFLFSTKIMSFFAPFFIGLAFIYGPTFIRTWMGPEYNDSTTVLLVLLVPVLFVMAQRTMIPLLFGISQHKIVAYSNAVEGSMNLALNIWLVKSYGILGVGIGTAVPMGIMTLFVHPFFVARSINLRLTTYFTVLGKNLAFGCLLVAAGWYFAEGFLAESYTSLAACVAFQALLYWPLIFYLGFEPAEKKRLLDASHGAFLSRFRKREGEAA